MYIYIYISGNHKLQVCMVVIGGYDDSFGGIHMKLPY